MMMSLGRNRDNQTKLSLRHSLPLGKREEGLQITMIPTVRRIARTALYTPNLSFIRKTDKIIVKTGEEKMMAW